MDDAAKLEIEELKVRVTLGLVEDPADDLRAIASEYGFDLDAAIKFYLAGDDSNQSAPLLN